MSCLKFKTPSSYWIAGPTSSGKTVTVSKLIRNRSQMFEDPPVRVHYCYKEYQPAIFGRMEKEDGVLFHQGAPTLETMKSWSREVAGRHVLIILDDMQNEIVKNVEMSTAFTVLSHHCNLSVMCLVQNLFPQARYSRDISLNCGYMLLMKTKRDRSQLMSLARQLCPGQVRFFMSAYDDAVSSENFAFLLVDIHPNTPAEYMLRSSIWPDQMTVVYRPEV